MKMRRFTAIALSALLALFFAGCGDKNKDVSSGADMTDEQRIVSAAKAGMVGNWGLGNEYEIQALLAKYDQPTDYVSMDFTMDQFDTDAITLASAMTYNELGLVKNDYDGGYGYGDKVGIIDMNDQGVAMLEDMIFCTKDFAKENPNIELITGDLGFGVLKPFWERLPDQFINAGIAEQNMTSAAAGMALEGKTVFTYSIGNFPTLRCLEQIRNDCAYHGANVKIVCVGGGFVYGSLGMSHHATEDIAVMRALPGVAVLCPGDLVEAEEATKAIAKYPGTCYLRLGRGGEKRIHDHIDNFEIGKAIKIHDGEKIAIFSTGAIFEEVADAEAILAEHDIYPAVYTFPTVKPIDRAAIVRCAVDFDMIVTVEEHNIVGGFGSAVAEVLAELPERASLLRVGIHDTYSSIVGSQKYLRSQFGLDSGGIATQVLEALQ